MTTKAEIISYLRNKKYGGQEWIAGGVIEDYIRQITKSKGSTTSKRLREMSGEGKTYVGEPILEKKTIDGYVCYKLIDKL